MTGRARPIDFRKRPIESVWTRNRRVWPPKPAQPPGPEEQEWPPEDLGVILEWSGLMVPDPPMHILAIYTIPWVPAQSWFYGAEDCGVYQVRVWFHLDLYTGAYVVYIQLWKGPNMQCAVSSEVGTTPPNYKFDITITEWISLWPTHVLEVTFRS